MTGRVARARERARDDARSLQLPGADGRPRRFVAVGDPQASLLRFLQVLDEHSLLGDDGRLRPDVGLVSIGDHFDWGGVAMRARAAEDSSALLSWLAAHPSDQTILIAGNHDLARVGELWDMSDARFVLAQALADNAYYGGDSGAAQRFFEENPTLPTAEIVARDLSTFREAQRALVSTLLTARRMRLAFARSDLLFTHACVTLDELAALGLEARAPAPVIADALNHALDHAWQTRPEGPFCIPHLHVPGSRAREGEGMLFHRASALPGEKEQWSKPIPRRRFSPLRLPAGLSQVIGHIHDAKSRGLLGVPGDAQPGRLRTLHASDGGLQYRLGWHPADADVAHVVYIDGGMARVDAASEYALFDIEERSERL